MTRCTVAFLCVALVASVVPPAFAQARARHRTGINAIVGSLDLTDAQKASVKAVVQSHRAELQAARAGGDKTAIRQARRAVLQDVMNVLTPDQRDKVKAQIKKKLRKPGRSN
jgi:Spy/CpxP family protein refolding chaperone